MLLGPSVVHAVEHAGPVTGFGASSSSLDGEVGVVWVAWGIEQGEKLERSEVFLKLVEGCSSFLCGVKVIEFLGQLDPRGQVREVRFELQKGLKLVLLELCFCQDLTGFFLVVPKFRLGRRFFELGDSFGQLGDVKDTS